MKKKKKEKQYQRLYLTRRKDTETCSNMKKDSNLVEDCWIRKHFFTDSKGHYSSKSRSKEDPIEVVKTVLKKGVNTVVQVKVFQGDRHIVSGRLFTLTLVSVSLTKVLR